MKNDNVQPFSKREKFIYWCGQVGKNVILSKRRIRQLAWWLNRILRRRHDVQRVDVAMEYEFSEYRFTIRELAFIPTDSEHCDLVLLRPKIAELRSMVNSRDPLQPEVYRILFGKMFYGDREYFANLAIFTLNPLLQDGEDALQCRDVAGLEEVMLVQCKFRATAGEIMAFHGPDAIRMIGEMKQTILAGCEMISAKFRFRIKTMKKAQTLKIKLGNRAEFPYCCEKIIEAWLTARGFKHGSR